MKRPVKTEIQLLLSDYQGWVRSTRLDEYAWADGVVESLEQIEGAKDVSEVRTVVLTLPTGEVEEVQVPLSQVPAADKANLRGRRLSRLAQISQWRSRLEGVTRLLEREAR